MEPQIASKKLIVMTALSLMKVMSSYILLYVPSRPPLKISFQNLLNNGQT